MIKKLLSMFILLIILFQSLQLTTTAKYQNTCTSNKKLYPSRGVAVLCYHSVNPNSTNDIIITPQLLKKHLTHLKNSGYVTLSLNDLSDYLIKNKTIPEKSILITFDDGYMDNYYYAFPILKNLKMKATIFCITHTLDGQYYLSKNAIKIMSDYGIDIGSHTVNHADLNDLNYNEQMNEMQNSKQTLEKITHKKVISLAYPFGHYNLNSIQAAKNSGYSLAFTTNNGMCLCGNDSLKLNRIYISSKYDIPQLDEAIRNALS